MRCVNLMPQARIDAHLRQERRHAWCIGVSSYVGSLLLIAAAAYLWWPDQHAAVAAELASVQEQTQKDEAAISALRPRIREAMSSLAAARSIGDQPDWSLLLGLLSKLLGDDTVLSSCKLTVALPTSDEPAPDDQVRHLLSLTGLGRSHAAVLEYVRKLEQIGLFQAVTVIDTRSEPFTDGQAIAFHIECHIPADGGRVP